MLMAAGIIADFQKMRADRWGYIANTCGEMWTEEKQRAWALKNEKAAKYGQQWVGHRVADCSGAFVWAYKQHGLSIYHGSNRIARRYVQRLLPISEVRPGMAVFKARRPGNALYALPDEYRQGGAYYDGDLNDYYHIGLADADAAYVLNSQSTQTGFVRSKTADNWQYAAYLKDVCYEEEIPMPVLYQAVVTAENGKPVNLRRSPSLSAARICTVPVGAEVAVMNEVNEEWAEIAYGDKTGYMMRAFLRKIETQEADGRLQQISGLLEEAQRLVRELMGG